MVNNQLISYFYKKVPLGVIREGLSLSYTHWVLLRDGARAYWRYAPFGDADGAGWWSTPRDYILFMGERGDGSTAFTFFRKPRSPVKSVSRGSAQPSASIKALSAEMHPSPSTCNPAHK